MRRTVAKSICFIAAVGVALAAWYAVSWWNLNSAFANLPNRTLAWGVWGATANERATAAGVTLPNYGPDRLEAYVPGGEVGQSLNMRGFVPDVLIRASMPHFTDANSSGVSVFARGRLVAGQCGLEIDGNELMLRRIRRANGESCFGVGVPVIVDRTETAEPTLPEKFSRIWKSGMSARSSVFPSVSPSPLYQVDWFSDGDWLCTVAFFESPEAQSAAKIDVVRG